MECKAPLPTRLLLSLGGPLTPCPGCGTLYGLGQNGEYLYVTRPK